MPRIPRKFLKTAFFHIITQGINKSFIFQNPSDIKLYIRTMYKLKEEHKINIIAYCIMNNHAHMLLEIEDLKELSKYMQRLNTKYAIYYNKKYNRVGYVFRDRYKSEGICTEEHLYHCIRYIYNNPVKAGMCELPEQYPYSNYKKIEQIVEDKYSFIDVDEDKKETCQKIINEFLQENKLELMVLKKDKEMLQKLVVILKEQYNISLRKIAEELNVGREKIRKLYKD